MFNMKIDEKRVYLEKFIGYLTSLGWNMYEPAVEEFSICEELQMFGDELLYNEDKFPILMKVVELFDDGEYDEAMDLSQDLIGKPEACSFSDYFKLAQKDEVFPWLG